MAKRKKNNSKDEEVLVDLVEARDNVQSFVDKNQNAIFGGLVVVVLAIGGLILYNNQIVPKQAKASAEAMWNAENAFARDSFQTVLTDIEDNASEIKGSAKSVAAYYEGVSYLKLGDYDKAIETLSKVKAPSKSVLSIMKHGTLGDAYSEKGEFSSALSQYEKAAKSDNESITPIYLMRLGMLQQKENKASAAQKTFERVVKDFPKSSQVANAEKYLTSL